QTSPAGPANGDLNAGFDGDDDTTLVTGVTIVGHATHTYRITVTATVDEPVAGSGRCDAGGDDGGFLNTATLTANGEPQDPDSACAEFSPLRLGKPSHKGN